MGTSLLIALCAALAFRTVRASYSRTTRESVTRGIVAAFGASIGSLAAYYAVPSGETTLDVLCLVAMLAAAIVGTVAALIGLLALEDAGLKVPA